MKPLHLGYSSINRSDYDFMESISAGLEQKNSAAFSDILNGMETLSCPKLDSKMIRMEQNYVQKHLDSLFAKDPVGAQALVDKLNAKMNIAGGMGKLIGSFLAVTGNIWRLWQSA